MANIEVIEIISTKRKDTAGRILLLGSDDHILRRSIDDDIVLEKRFGTLGLARNDSLESFGIPILDNKELAYYLIATYLKAQRAVPFRGCIINAAQAKEQGNNILGFLAAWEKFLQNSPEVDLETYKPGKIILELDDQPLHHPRRTTGRVKEEMEMLVNNLEEGKILRFFTNHNAREFIHFLLSREAETYRYAWTTAPFDFPQEPDGARLHIAVLPAGKKYERENKNITVLENYALAMAPPKNDMIYPIKLKTIKTPTEITSTSWGEPAAGISPGAKGKRYKKKLISLSIFLAVFIGLFLLIFTFFKNTGSECKGEKWLRGNLGEISFNRSLPEQIDAVFWAKEVLRNPGCSSSAIQTCKRLLGSKMEKIQDLIVDRVKSEWRFFDNSELLVKKWFSIIDDAKNLEFNDKPGIGGYKKELTGLAGREIRNYIQEQIKPTGESLKNLDYVSMVLGKYPVEFDSLAQEARQFSQWIGTEIQAREMWSQRIAYESFQQVHHLLEKFSPPGICKPTYYKLQYDNINDWTGYQLPRTKVLYNDMIDLEKNFDWMRLKGEFTKLFDIPGQRTLDSEAYRVFKILKEFERKKVVKVEVFDVRFSGPFKKQIRAYFEDKKKKDESTKKSVKKPQISLELYSDGEEYDSVIIENKKNFTMPVKISFISQLSIHVLLDYTTFSTLNSRFDLSRDWLKREGSIEKIVLNDFEGNQLIEFNYKIPTARQLGLKRWE